MSRRQSVEIPGVDHVERPAPNQSGHPPQIIRSKCPTESRASSAGDLEQIVLRPISGGRFARGRGLFAIRR